MMKYAATEVTAIEERERAVTHEFETSVPRYSTHKQLAILTTLSIYCTIIVAGVSHHEPWADEAQAWLLSRDLGYRYLIFHQLAYEGVPPLWPTILWVANHWFHLPYHSLGWIGGLCAFAGAWFFCRYSPFPLLVRVLFPFTYFMAFQYAVVARPYVLLPLCTFAAAQYFGNTEKRPWRFVAAVSALALLCAPGVMMAAGLVAARGWYIFTSWNSMSPRDRKRLIGALIVFALVLLFVARVNWPPSDHSFARLDRAISEGNFGWRIVPRDLSAAFLGSPIASTVLVSVIGIWCAYRRRLLVLLLPAALVLAFFVRVYGNFWHCGALTFVVVAALWITWEPQEPRAKPYSTVKVLAQFGLACLLAVHIYWAGCTLIADYSRPYSGSLDAATFLRSVGADSSSTCGFGFHSVAIAPYFRQKIYKNWPDGESFWRHENGNHLNETCNNPRWVVLPRCCSFDRDEQGKFYLRDRSLRSQGYFPVHFSQGSMFFEGREIEPTDFIIYGVAPILDTGP